MKPGFEIRTAVGLKSALIVGPINAVQIELMKTVSEGTEDQCADEIYSAMVEAGVIPDGEEVNVTMYPEGYAIVNGEVLQII